ncbi:invasion associated locus B family protein [Mesorhizobium sp. BE184]|uniref:invasion associated locus B family protein n=1 Tax=Mesorhizobium sp. BE184 TaxID=2817714 RepID=UPI002862C7DF|nr:invasion associated locus B family protein [Mesorhizobium sp. BE184]MDR7033606.1 invasion protein IalB [Mesorhizobium sp. BE184]
MAGQTHRSTNPAVAGRKFRSATFFTALLLAGGTGAFAQQEPLAEKSGWRLNCAADGKCELGFTQTNSGQLVTRLLIYKVGKKIVVEYLVPLGVNLQKGILLQIDGKPAFPTQSLYCEAPGCVGFAPLSPDLLAQLKRGAQLKLAFSPHAGSTFYAFDYPLDGFSAQYAAFLSGVVPAEKPQAEAGKGPGKTAESN